MRYAEEQEQSPEYMKAAMRFMAKHGVTPNPATIAVWYDYVSGRDPGLIWAIDKTLKEKGKLTTASCEEIYEKYIGNQSEQKAFRRASDQLQNSLSEVRACIGEAGRDHGAYGKKLIGITTQLEDGGSAEEVAGLVRGILGETRQVIEKNKALENRLAESSKEIDQLQDNLQQVRRQAMTDPLTGIPNRKYFDALLAEETEKAAEKDSALSLLFADIENFRAFKALYGAEIGDEVIKFVAGLLGQVLESGHTLARYGGEEFAIILPRSDSQDGLLMADRIRDYLASRKLKNLKTGERYGAISLAFGVAAYRSGEAAELFVRRASEALFSAKEKGIAGTAAEPQPEASAIAGE